MKMIATTCAAFIVTGVLGQAQTPATQPQAPRPKLVDVTKVGCLKAWQPASPDPTRLPDPPKTGTYILTPPVVDPNRASNDMPSYVLVGGSTVNFMAHVNHKVEISGVEAVAQLPPTAPEIAAAAAVMPENKPDTRTMPSLTVQSLKMISTACP